MRYEDFLERKSQLGGRHGFEPLFMPDCMMDFQAHLTTWALKRGRAALLEDCGTGKTLQYLVWAQNIVEKTNENVLIATPLAVAPQTVSEGIKFGIECKQSRDGKSKGKITVTNYEKLHLFDRSEYGAFVGDESGCMKNFEGVTKNAVTQFVKKMRYRLLCTATAAPNDYPELGTHSEALGELGYMDMLKRFFKNDNNTCDIKRNWRKHGGPPPKYRFLKHAEPAFWRFVASWARAIRKPSDIGFDDGQFVLPELIENQHMVGNAEPLPGRLFPEDIIGMKDQRTELRRTLNDRCESAAQLAINQPGPSVCWAHLNTEGDLLTKLIPGAVQIHGRQSDDEKEELLSGFVKGHFTKLVTKASIAGFGLNWQHCGHMTVFPWHSFEEYYQSIRRSWRFGRLDPVNIDIVTTPGLSYVLANLKRKAKDAERMYAELIAHMNEAIGIDRQVTFKDEARMPQWIL